MTTEQIYNYKNSNYENTSYEWNMPLRGNPRKSRTKKIIDLGKDGFFYLSDRSLIFRWFFVFLLLTQIREKKDFILLPGMNCSNVDSRQNKI